MASPLSTNQVNYLNIALMALSALLAFLYPFELFLLAYAVLGPLHYLTEISWLHDKNYYTRGKGDFLFLLGASAVITAVYLGWIPFTPKGTIEFLTGLAFLGALFFVLLKDAPVRWIALLPAALAVFFFARSPLFQVVFGVFLPTLIHVFVFTGLFILAGALRGRSLPGLMSLAFFIVLACGFIFIHPAHADYRVSDYVKGSYGYLKENGTGSSPFIAMNFYIARALHFSGLGPATLPLSDFVRTVNAFLYQDPAALALMSFIAFAYTYHYFNWFSKTSIIGWHEIPRSRALGILTVWGLSLGLYAYDYSVGLKWLFFLSFTHVLLEFPLNQLTLMGIGKEVRKALLPQPPGASR
jgi:hypothetical protein